MQARFVLDNYGDSYGLRAISEQTGKEISVMAKICEGCSIAQQVQIIKVMLESLEAKLYHEALENHVDYLKEKEALKSYNSKQKGE